MKKIILLISSLMFSSLLLFASGVQAQQYAELSKLERKGAVWTIQADYVDLVTPINCSYGIGDSPPSRMDLTKVFHSAM